MPTDELRDQIARRVREDVRLRLGPRAIEQAANGPIMLSGTEADAIADAALADVAPELERLRGELAEAQEVTIASLDSQVERFREEVADLHRALVKEIGRAKQAEAKLADYRAAAGAEADLADELKAELSATRRERDALKAELAEARAAIHQVFDCWADPFGNWTAEQADAARAQKSQMLQRLLTALDTPSAPESTREDPIEAIAKAGPAIWAAKHRPVSVASPGNDGFRYVPAPEKPTHIGGRANAEDCPACEGTNPPYPFICPGEPETPGED